MVLFYALVVGLVFWVVGWAFGFKAFDSFLVLFLFLVMAIAVRAFMPLLHKALGRT